MAVGWNDTHGHDRLCWLSQKRSEKRSCIRHLKTNKTVDIPLVTRRPRSLKIDHRDLTNRVTTSFTLVGSSAGSRLGRSLSLPLLNLFPDVHVGVVRGGRGDLVPLED
jgi:hypothetical protein